MPVSSVDSGFYPDYFAFLLHSCYNLHIFLAYVGFFLYLCTQNVQTKIYNTI